MTDRQLYKLCKKYGRRALEARRKFAGLLPEVMRRKLYEKKGFSSVFEYAAKLAGLSHEQVSRALSLHEKFGDKPVLKSLLVTGEVSINKLARIASIATVDNQLELAGHVKTLSQEAIETLVRDVRRTEEGKMPTAGVDRIGLQKPLFGQDFVRAHDADERGKCAYRRARVVAGNPQANPDGMAEPLKMLELKLTKKNLDKLLKLQGKGIDINGLLEEMIKKREAEIAAEKEDAALNQEQKVAGWKEKLDGNANHNNSPSRHIPAKIRHILDVEQGNKCAAPGCQKAAQVIHHELPFAIAKNHDPRILNKLCKGHHELAHGINLKIYEIKKKVVNTA